MAEELAAFYHPGASDPVGKLTVPELLAAVELACHDLAEMIKRYVPGGHLLTVDNLRQARKMTDWYGSARNVYWLVSALFNPLNTAVRFAASQAGLGIPWQQIQKNLIAWLYASFVHRLGAYLIELQSGRLKVGAIRYRELLGQQEGKTSAPKPSSGAPEIEAEPPVSPRVALALLGQVGVGKSSLINALLGEQKALTDSVPTPTGITRYELKPPSTGTELVLYDTPGYGQEGVDAPAMKRVQEAARSADFLLVVLHARSPARAADLEMLQKLREWFARHPELKEPPILAVVTHIDLLSPAMEWAPPYDWEQPTRPKEKSIHECMAVVNEQLGPYLVDAVPVCTAEGKVTGVEEDLLPAITVGLDEARAVAMLRCLHSEIDAGSVKRIFAQLLEGGKAVAREAWKSLKGGG
jgi:predicted GTPase